MDPKVRLATVKEQKPVVLIGSTKQATQPVVNNAALIEQLSGAGLLHVLLATYCAEGNAAGVKELIDVYKVDPNRGITDQRTPLHLASEEGNLEVVKVLLARGANVNAADKWGDTPLRCATAKKYEDIVALLKAQGGSLFKSPTMNSSLKEFVVRKEEQLEEIKEIFGLIATGITQNIVSPNLRGPPGRMLSKTTSIGSGLTLEHSPQLSMRSPVLRGASLSSSLNATLDIKALGKYLERYGLYYKKHPELKSQLKALDKQHNGNITIGAFTDMMKGPEILLQRAIRGQLVIPNWPAFVKEVTDMFMAVRSNTDGVNASYIPDLVDIDPELYGLSIVSVDGQILELGNTNANFSLQGNGKPLIYSIMCDDFGHDEVHKHIGQSPSTGLFSLNEKKKVHNPFTNSGALVISSMFHRELNPSKRYNLLTSKLSEFAGGQKVGFNLPVYLSEKSVDTNYAIAHFMQSEHAFPPGTKVSQAVDFYFQMCSCEVNCNVLSAIAATYSNSGVNPLTNKQCISATTAKRTLQLMYSCGMYDFSGEWACTIGLPAKSGASGALFAAVPNVLGLCIYSPRLTPQGNSARGVDLCSRLATHFGWNVFDVIFSHHTAAGRPARRGSRARRTSIKASEAKPPFSLPGTLLDDGPEGRKRSSSVGTTAVELPRPTASAH